MTIFGHQKGKKMPTSAPTKARSKAAARLQQLREKAVCRVHKSNGDQEEIRRDGLEVYRALKGVRERANRTAHEK